MDEEAYRRMYLEVNDRQCFYEKAILGTHCICSRMRKLNLAEREAVRCESAEGHQRCHDYLEQLRRAARFVLRSRAESTALPHAKAIRLQVGGLRGLHAALHPGRTIPSPVPDIDGLLGAAVEKFGSLQSLPYQEIIPEIAAWEGRRPKRRRR